MGHTAVEWELRVLEKLNDVDQIDTSATSVVDVGVGPALAQFSIDRPRTAAVDLTPTGQHLALPTAVQGWVSGWSEITRIEAPAGQTPPCRIDPGQWVLTRDPDDPETVVVLLPAELAAGEQARVFFTTTWPSPTSTAADDLVPDIAFEAVTALAAAYVCVALATSAAFGRQAALPTSFVDGTERSRNLLDAADRLRTLYNTFIGLGQAGQSGGDGSVSAKVLRSSRFR